MAVQRLHGWLMVVFLALVSGLGVLIMASSSADAAGVGLLHGTPLPTGTPDPLHTPQYVEDGDKIPTYYQDIKPIFDQHCAMCHSGNGIGKAFFDVEDHHADEIAADLAQLVRDGYMPPWMPSDEGLALQHERSMSAEEIALVELWALSGAEMGDHDTARGGEVIEISAVRPDVVVEMPEAYRPDERLNDDYRCFLIDPNLTEDIFVEGYTIDPGEASIVHHVILFKLEARYEMEAKALDRRHEGVGWECFGGAGVGPDQVLGTWTPGTMPVFYQEKMVHQVKKDDLFVMQVHYNLLAGVAEATTRAILQTTAPSDDLELLESLWMFAPVEIPCPAGIDTPECQREAAIEYAEQYDPNAGAQQNGVLSSCGKRVEDYATQDASAVMTDCVQRSWMNVRLVEILPHMHTRGTSIRVELNPASDAEVVLIDIPRWDFHWQGSYQFVDPVEIRAGDYIKLTCIWDNSREPQPRYIVWGEGTQDEMCLVLLTFVQD